MFLLRNEIGIAAAVAFALTACGGRVIVPTSGPPANTSDLISDAANPCYTAAVQPAWIFKGSCFVTKLPSTGVTIKLKPYHGITETTSLPKNSGKNGFFALVDAIGGADILKFRGKAFPLNKAGKSVVYVEAVNGTKELRFTSGNLTLSAASKGKLPSKQCHLAYLKPTLKWFDTPLSPSKITSNAVTFTIPATAIAILFPPRGALPKGPLFFDLFC